MKENRVFPVCSAVTLGPLLDVGPFTAPPKLKDGWLLSLDGSVVLTEGPADPIKLNKGAEVALKTRRLIIRLRQKFVSLANSFVPC